MAVGQLGTPRWAQHDERRDYANHPDGNEDRGNRAMQDFYTSYTVQHDYATGAHALAGVAAVENGTYTGNGVDSRNISLSNSSLTIDFLLIWRADTEYPVLRSSDMTGDATKELETNAFQADMIQSIATTGQFQVGTDAAVNANGVDYWYLAIGGV